MGVRVEISGGVALKFGFKKSEGSIWLCADKMQVIGFEKGVSEVKPVEEDCEIQTLLKFKMRQTQMVTIFTHHLVLECP